MNDQTSPRFVCRATRAWSAKLQPDRCGEPASLFTSHVANCPACHDYFAACGELDTALRTEARSMRSAHPGLETRVIQAVDRSRAPLRHRPSRGGWGLGLAGFAVASLAVAVFVSKAPTPSAPDSRDVALDSQAMMESFAAMGTASREWWNAVAPSAAELARQDPLRDELDSVYSDAQTAAAFLARNFLPDAGLSPSAPPSDQRQQG